MADPIREIILHGWRGTRLHVESGPMCYLKATLATGVDGAAAVEMSKEQAVALRNWLTFLLLDEVPLYSTLEVQRD